MAQKKFSELEAGAVDGTSIFAQTKTEDGSLVSKGASSTSLAGYIGTSHQFAGLNTNAKNLVGAINEAAQSGGGASVIQLTQAEYTALSTAEKMNGSIYKLTDKAIFYCLDEEYHAVKELTTAQYEALSTAEKNNGTIYIQTDAETTGSDISVSDSDSTSVADKIDAIPVLKTETVSGTLSTTTYGGLYYVDISPIVSTNRIISAIVIANTGNNWAYCQITGSNIRVWANNSGGSVSIRYAYI